MNNDLPPSWIFEEVVTINCEFSLFGLSVQESSCMHSKYVFTVYAGIHERLDIYMRS